MLECGDIRRKEERDMPLFDFRCRDCGEVSELLLRDGDASVAACPSCGGTDMEKMFSPFNTPRSYHRPHGLTCCGREERCEAPPCEAHGCCSE